MNACHDISHDMHGVIQRRALTRAGAMLFEILAFKVVTYINLFLFIYYLV